jgi:hypothetical protein
MEDYYRFAKQNMINYEHEDDEKQINALLQVYRE